MSKIMILEKENMTKQMFAYSQNTKHIWIAA